MSKINNSDKVQCAAGPDVLNDNTDTFDKNILDPVALYTQINDITFLTCF